ncbi:MAG: thioesterase family protein [Candidatus Promineifilaceae bacterium]|jgi:acyl-CoA thioesterase FadM
MNEKSSISLTTRMADLDPLRHVNNRIYEQFCAEGRYRLLEEHGYSLQALLNHAIVLRPIASFVKFERQQRAGIELHVQTEAFPLEDGLILWDHHISGADGEPACYLQAKTAALDGRSNPVELLAAVEKAAPGVYIEDVPEFSGNCERTASAYSAIYTDRDVFGRLPLAAYWRVFEEGRHMFGEQLGLTMQKLVQLDTHVFWIAGTYQCYKPIAAGQQVIIHTWLERIDRIRAYFRQEIRSAAGDLLGASREQHLIVSLSESRPKTAPSELAAILEPYIEIA